MVTSHSKALVRKENLSISDSESGVSFTWAWLRELTAMLTHNMIANLTILISIRLKVFSTHLFKTEFENCNYMQIPAPDMVS